MTMAAETRSPAPTIAMPTDREIVISHTFDAPRELVFKAYTDPRFIPNWWGPRYLTTTVETMDVRPGGRWRFVQRAPDGGVHAFNGEYQEVLVPERLVNTFEYEGTPGQVVLETHTFEERGGRTTVTSRALFRTREERDGMVEAGMELGVRESAERLTEIFSALVGETDREIKLTRTFDAPRELVYRAYTDPEQFVQWWGPNGFTTALTEMDVRPGGVARFIMHGPDGTDYPSRFVYREVVAPERLAFVHDEGEDGPEEQRFEVTVTFADEGGKTRVSQRMVLASTDARDDTVAFGAIQLGYQTLGKLAEYLASR